MDHHYIEGIDYFGTHQQQQHFRAVSSYLCLTSQLDRLISGISKNAVFFQDIPRCLDHVQIDISALGDVLDTQKALLHHRHLTIDLGTLADAVRMSRITHLELIECLEFSRLDLDAIG